MARFVDSDKTSPSTDETESVEWRQATLRTIARTHKIWAATDWASSTVNSAPACSRARARNSSTSASVRRNPNGRSSEAWAILPAWQAGSFARRKAEIRSGVRSVENSASCRRQNSSARIPPGARSARSTRRHLEPRLERGEVTTGGPSRRVSVITFRNLRTGAAWICLGWPLPSAG